jgi:addiction module HigA family antidote
MTKFSPVHPGEILVKEFIEPLGVTQHKVAVAIGVPPRRINEIAHGRRRITADTALRLGKFFGVSADFWLNLQMRYDLEIETDVMGDLGFIEPLSAVNVVAS